MRGVEQVIIVTGDSPKQFEANINIELRCLPGSLIDIKGLGENSVMILYKQE